jgi:hypothetical protein
MSPSGVRRSDGWQHRQSQTQGMRSVAKTDPADALLAFEHDVVANADCAELQHLAGFARAVQETYKTPLQPLARSALVYALRP